MKWNKISRGPIHSGTYPWTVVSVFSQLCHVIKHTFCKTQQLPVSRQKQKNFDVGFDLKNQDSLFVTL